MTVSSQTKVVGGPPGASSFARKSSGAPRFDPVVASLEFKPGVVIGDFELVKRLGVGGMGAVWHAQQRSLQRPVALKLIRPELLDAETVEMFEREARAGGRLHHAGIVTVYAAGQVDGIHFIAQELVEGGHHLGAALAELRELDATPPDYAREVAGLIAGVADALKAAHDAGVIHRDIKPQNLLLDGEGQPKVSDFGLAHVVNEQSLTGKYGILGSVYYMSPEQAAAKSIGIDHRTDVFSLGVVLYEMLALRRPFEGDAEQQVLEKILHEDPPPPAKLRSRVPTDLSVICMKAIEKRRDQRYATMGEFADDLRRFLGNEPIHARPAGVARRAQKWTLRHPTVAATIGLGVASLAVISALLFQTLKAKRAADANAITAEQNAQTATRREGEANRARADAEQRALEVLRLSDGKRLRDLEARAKKLWPARPEIVPDLERWLAEADELARNLPQHQASLARLDAPAAAAAGAAPLLADEQRVWWRDTLHDLVAGLTRFLDDDPWIGLRADVRRRLASAKTLQARSVDAFHDGWDDAVASIADSATYDHLKVAPQLGLAPLGPDPDSGLWEFWDVDTGTPPERDAKSGKLRMAGDSAVVLVLLPGGKFRMGAQKVRAELPNFDPEAQIDEAVHEVTLAPFFLSKFEMTQAQWRTLTHASPSFFGPDRPGAKDTSLRPVEQVTWDECVAVLARGGLVLPTEAQWEYGARGGTATPWWTGAEKEALATAANLADASYVHGNRDANAAESWDDGASEPADVGGYSANPFGLHDVVGNVWEWCADAYAPYDRPPRAGDGLRTAPDPAAMRERVMRGGGFSTRAASARVAFRARFLADSRDNDLGVRPARGVDAR